MTAATDLPEELHNYISFIEENTGVPISIVSVGPDRKQTIVLKKQVA
ncbi:MAG TPA: adenylosuccinate synthetase [Bacteroidia bacterium]|nr:adenylosuccinate synthetase [Bacteroidia bacterium]